MSILGSDTANQAKSKLLAAAIKAPINKALKVPIFIAEYPPIIPPTMVANTPKNFE